MASRDEAITPFRIAVPTGVRDLTRWSDRQHDLPRCVARAFAAVAH